MESLVYTVLIQIVSILLIIYEFREIFEDPLPYFLSIWNWLDMLGNIGIIVHCVIFEIHGESMIKYEKVKMNLIFASFVIGMRAISALSVFKKYRIFIELLKRTLFDMTTFLTLLIFVTGLFGLLRFIRNYEFRHRRKFFYLGEILDQYEIMFGDNPEVNDLI